MIFLHDPNKLLEERESDIIGFATHRMESDKPTWLKIIDPHFVLEMLVDADKKPKNKRFWRNFFEEVSTISSLGEVKIITTKPFGEYVKQNHKLKELTRFDDRLVNYKFNGYCDITICAFQYIQ